MENQKKSIFLKIGVVGLIALFSVGVFSMSSGAEGVEDFTVTGWVDGVHATADESVPVHPYDLLGWAFSDNGDSVKIWLTTDREGMNVVGATETVLARSDVQDVFDSARLKSGFSWTVPARYYDGVDHKFFVWGSRTTMASFSVGDSYLIGETSMEGRDGGVIGSLDGVSDGNLVSGWAVDLDSLYAGYSQDVPVLFYVDGNYVGSAVTSDVRADVEDVYSDLHVGANHGFHATLNLTRSYNDGNAHLLEAFIVETSEGSLYRLPGQQYIYLDDNGVISNVLYYDIDENGDAVSSVCSGGDCGSGVSGLVDVHDSDVTGDGSADFANGDKDYDKDALIQF